MKTKLIGGKKGCDAYEYQMRGSRGSYLSRLARSFIPSKPLNSTTPDIILASLYSILKRLNPPKPASHHPQSKPSSTLFPSPSIGSHPIWADLSWVLSNFEGKSHQSRSLGSNPHPGPRNFVINQPDMSVVVAQDNPQHTLRTAVSTRSPMDSKNSVIKTEGLFSI